jgi:Leucine-rich repeat (LRR) protein
MVLPEGIGRLAYLPRPGLKKLDLNFNSELGTLPEGLSALAGLEELRMMDCGLTALPESIGALAGLRKLDLFDNKELTALPAGLCALAGLEELYLFGCGLRALPEGIGGLAGLRKLDLNSNHGLRLPVELWSLAGLEELHLRECGLTVLPEGVRAMTGLRKLDLGRNYGLTALPEGLWSLVGLVDLDLGYTYLGYNIEQAALHAGLGRLRNLEELGLAGCPGLAALHALQEREGLPALLAHLAAQGKPAAAEGQL